MRSSEIKSWALEVIEAARRGHPNEDLRVELKREWIGPVKAARRIAGHANAARGEAILWIIGVGEDGKIHPLERAELSSWWNQIKAQFDPPIPEVRDVVVHLEGDSVLALYFETGEAPYLVKNPDGGTVEFEVPWRDGTGVRTARHADLIRILVPQAKLPEVQVLEGRLVAEGYRNEFGAYSREVGKECRWELTLDLYLVPGQDENIVIPPHQVHVLVEEPESFGKQDFRAYQSRTLGSANTLIADRKSNFFVEGPGRLELRASYEQEVLESVPGPTATGEIRMRPAGHSHSIVIRCDFERSPDKSWIFQLSDKSVVKSD